MYFWRADLEMAGDEQLQSATMPEPTTPAQPQGESHEPQPKQEEEQDEERVLTLSEVLQEESMLAETADAVLGDASDTSCSYALGHIRQVRTHSSIGFVCTWS